jgi:hypothetical protein
MPLLPFHNATSWLTLWRSLSAALVRYREAAELRGGSAEGRYEVA